MPSATRHRLQLVCQLTSTAAAFSPSRSILPTLIRHQQHHPLLLARRTMAAGRTPSTRSASEAGSASDGEPQKKRHTLLTFGYTGTGWYGLQSQSAEGNPEMPTLSDALRKALLEEGFIAPSNFVTLERSKWSLASRTDKGVHAACAAASVFLETYEADVVEQDELEKRRDPAALDYAGDVAVWNSRVEAAEKRAGMTMEEAAAKGTKLSIGRQPPKGSGEWQLSESALARLNAALPEGVRIFSGSKVRKRFHAREEASSRVYEYLLPQHALGDRCTVEQFDELLRTYEGTHRFHNFASGLRVKQEDASSFATPDGEEWPLALREGDTTSAAFRSIITCRVHSQAEVDGTPYLVLRISGLAFQLHQIRHMVGGALAVANGVVPRDIMRMALRCPFRFDVSPLVPGMGLLLDEISWFNLKDGSYEARLPAAARTAMQDFKTAVIYPHIHALYCEGAYDDFLSRLREPEYGYEYGEEDYERARRVFAVWEGEIAEKVARRKEIRRQKRAEQRESNRGLGGGRGDRGGGRGKGGQQQHKDLLPGGLHMQICKEYQLMPGPETLGALVLLREQVERGALEPGEEYGVYLEALKSLRPEGITVDWP